MQTGVQTLIGPWTCQFSRTLVSSPTKGPNHRASLKGLGPVWGLEVGEGVGAGCEGGPGVWRSSSHHGRAPWRLCRLARGLHCWGR